MTESPRSAPKWCLWEVHRSPGEKDPFYTVMPEYGPWDTEHKARQVGEQLQRLEYENRELAVRELGEASRAYAASVTIEAVIESENATQSSTERNNEHLRWQPAAQHD